MNAAGRWRWRGANSRSTTRLRDGSSTTPRTSGATRWRRRAKPIERSGSGAQGIAAIGITNQRETAVLWDRTSGEPIHRAIVWQDRRTAPECARLRSDGAEELVRRRTGLLLDPYFSGTKIRWILDNVAGARARAERGELAFGTIDSFLLWRLTGGRVHATDVTNASRTMLFDIHRGEWDDELLRLLDVPRNLMPDVKDSSDYFGETAPGLLERSIPIGGIAGDQQAALVGQACFEPGMAKSTYGTGCFLLLNTGDTPVLSQNRMLTTPAYRIQGRTTYAMEGSIFVAGAAVKWLRDGLGLIGDVTETAALAMQVPDSHGVYMVPAFVGLGAPHWVPDARGLLCGLTLDTTRAHLARAALESVAYQTLDLTASMSADGARRAATIRVDGGMAANDWFCQFLADVGRYARRAAGRARDHRARRGVPRRARDRRVARPEGCRRHLHNSDCLHARHACGTPQRASRRLADRTSARAPDLSVRAYSACVTHVGRGREFEVSIEACDERAVTEERIEFRRRSRRQDDGAAAGGLDQCAGRNEIPGVESRIQHRAERALDDESVPEAVRIAAHVAVQRHESSIVLEAPRLRELLDIAGADDRVLEGEGSGQMQRIAVAGGAESGPARVRHVQDRQVDHAEQRPAFRRVLEADHGAEERDAAHEGPGAVDRVDRPAPARARAGEALLLAEDVDRTSRGGAGQVRADRRLRLPVRPGDW